MLHVIIDLELDATLHKSRIQLLHQNVNDADQVLLLELMEDHHFIDSVQELWAEGPAQLSQDFVFHALVLISLLRTLES